MIPCENGEKAQQYQRSALDGVGFGNLLATNQLRAMLVGSVRRRCHLGARWAHSLVAAPRALGARASLKLFNNFNDMHGHPPV
jgi:hypothetical protein